MHQVAHTWTYIFTNFPGVIPRTPKLGRGYAHFPSVRASTVGRRRPLPLIRSPNMQRDLTNRSTFGVIKPNI